MVSSFVRRGARSLLVMIVIGGLLNFSTMAASEKPLGMVVASQHARLDNANAVAGVDVYAGDTFATDAEGSLRLKLGGSQIYLLASSSAKLLQQENKVRASVKQGTLGFSTTTPGQIEIETPLATIRGVNGERMYGQVVVLGAAKMTVSAYQGTLVVSANDQEQIVKPGQSYVVSFAAEAAAGGQAPEGAVKPGVNKKKLAFMLIAIGGGGAGVAFLWHEFTESCSTAPCDQF
ncbi:MAG: hypothetical protein LAN59_00095 [Acidobacteriia bacterium]|nr:hypothetical protein [Terriglobia bacterium]